MKNPFIKTVIETKCDKMFASLQECYEQCTCEYTTSQCSINKVIINRLPIYGIEDELEGKKVSEIFSTKIFISEIKKNAEDLCIDLNTVNERELPIYLSKALCSCDDAVCKTADKIVSKMGKRLGIIFLTLKTGLPENRAAREDWKDVHWQYWNQVKNVILVGGLASGDFGKRLIEEAADIFRQAGVVLYDFIQTKDSVNAGVFGCLSQLKQDNFSSITNKTNTKINIVFDFGQTNIKRALAIQKKSCGKYIETEVINFSPLESKFMEWENKSHDQLFTEAKKLDEYLVDIICNTYREAQKYGKIQYEIIISIANYVENGRIVDIRGGYGKLKNISDNYCRDLSIKVSDTLSKPIKIQLIHDGTAVALAYSGFEDSVCVTMGTAFGIGFPEIKL